MRHADRQTLGTLAPCALFGLLAACFEGDATRGLPCDDDRSCGPALACEQGFCGGEPLGDDGDDGDDTTVSISGTLSKVYFDGGEPLAGVEITLADDPDIRAVTDAMGRFRLDGVPPSQPAYIVAAPSALYYGTVLGVDVKAIDVVDLNLTQASQVYIENVEQQLRMQDPTVEVDPDLGVVVLSSVTLGVTVGLDPVPTGARVFAHDPNGAAVLGATIIDFLFLPIVAWFDVEIAPSGTFEVSATHATMTCTPVLETPETRPRHISVVAILCQ